MSTFKIKSGKIIVTDPCYGNESGHCQARVMVKNGTWFAEVTRGEVPAWGNRVYELTAKHSSVGDAILAYKDHPTEICVDSGQAGFFDLAKYEDAKSRPDDYGDGGFYDKCCAITLSDNSDVSVGFGAVTSSGFGDGGYKLLVAKRGRQVVALRLVFIEESFGEESSHDN